MTCLIRITGHRYVIHSERASSQLSSSIARRASLHPSPYVRGLRNAHVTTGDKGGPIILHRSIKPWSRSGVWRTQFIVIVQHFAALCRRSSPCETEQIAPAVEMLPARTRALPAWKCENFSIRITYVLPLSKIELATMEIGVHCFLLSANLLCKGVKFCCRCEWIAFCLFGGLTAPQHYMAIGVVEGTASRNDMIS